MFEERMMMNLKMYSIHCIALLELRRRKSCKINNLNTLQRTRTKAFDLQAVESLNFQAIGFVLQFKRKFRNVSRFK